MSVNVYKPHVLVLPEDDANRQLVNGFLLDLAVLKQNAKLLPPAGGWSSVFDKFTKNHLPDLNRYPEIRIVLMIDFDDRVEERQARFIDIIPQDVRHRVFLLGTRSEPERLKAAVGTSLEAIGKRLAGECARREQVLWQHELLRHNQPEIDRLMAEVRPFLFQ